MEKYGLTSPIFQDRHYYKPFDYPWAFEYFKKQNHAHWMEEELNFADDVRDYNEKLTPGNQNLIKNILKFFTQADVGVAGGYYDHYLPIFKKPELRQMMGVFAAMEGTHMSAYSALVDTLGLPDDTYQMFLQYKSMVDKHEYLSDFGTEDLLELAKTIAVFSAFTEGVQLFASFAILLNFQRHNLMKNMGQVVAWSIRDETLHVEGMTKVFRTMVEENPQIWTDELKYEIYSAAERVVELEDAFIDTCFEGADLENLDISPAEVKAYIREIADRRLLALGLKAIFHSTPGNLTWLPGLLNGVEHVNFFENRATAYSRASTTGNWKDIFR